MLKPQQVNGDDVEVRWVWKDAAPLLVVGVKYFGRAVEWTVNAQ